MFRFSPTRESATRLNLFQSLPTARQLLHDGVHCGGPNKGFWILVPGGQELPDRLLEIFHAAEGAAADSLAG